MAAPKGNQYAKGHGCGRPRTVCPEDSDLEVLGEELVTWCTTEPTDHKLHITQWYSGEKFILERVWEKMIQKDVFRRYYEKALRILSIKYIDGTINATIAGRFLRLYFKDLRASDDELLKLKAELAKAQDKEEVAENVIRKLAQVVQAAEGKEKEKEVG